MAVLGIDLGTSNSAIAYASEAQPAPRMLPVYQLSAPSKVVALPLLPSVLYLAHSSDAATLGLPWAGEQSFAVGEYARDRAATAPERVVLSAKSWLCNSRVDRSAALLPWKAELDAEKVSPVLASQRYLEHLKQAFEHYKTQDAALNADHVAEHAPEVVITVPASFDEVARSLTLQAATQAGFSHISLLEEPLAAFYAWISSQDHNWREQVQAGDLVLVIDVGGGTADFSLIAVSDQKGELRLDRISVGEHILLGGDNMDLALAVALRAQLEQQGRKLDRWQFMSLVQAARKAKEALFSNEDKNLMPVALAGKGSSLFASALTAELTRELLHKVVLEGFWPLTAIAELPQERKAAGLQEFGLAYAADPAISRHLAKFLTRSLEKVKADPELRGLLGDLAAHEALGFLRPTKVLFNGGVFKAPSLRARVMQLLRQWCGAELQELTGAEFDLAVAMGAAQFGLIRQSGKGLRIRARTLRSYYIGIEASLPAIPGFEPPLHGLCVVPQGLEEGSSVELPGREFGLLTGEVAEFRFFSSVLRATDTAGVVVEEAEQELDESARLQLTLPALAGKSELVPVRLEAQVSEVGALELWMKHSSSDQRWKLDFNLRAEE